MATLEALIRQTLEEIAYPLFRESPSMQELEMSFQWIERKLCALLAWLRAPVLSLSLSLSMRGASAESASKERRKRSKEPERAAEAFVDHVLELVHKVSEFVRYHVNRWEKHDKVDRLNFRQTMGLLESLMADLTELARSLGLPYVDEVAADLPVPPIVPVVMVHKDKEGPGPVVGIEEDVQIVIPWLLRGNETRGVVSIVGEEGIGKTTLAKKVYTNSVIARHFPCRAWVTLPPQFNNSSVVEEIEKQFRAGRPSSEIIGALWDNKYMIVLDEVRTKEAWTTLQQLLPKTSNWSRILITTRNRDLIDRGPNCYVHEKRVLSDAEGWELFNANVGSSVPRGLEQLGREIVKKCLGLPPVILTVADSLSKKAATEEQWSMVLKEMINNQVILYYTTANSLSENLKQCLFYFGLFRQDYDIPARRLIVLWVAEGLFQQERGDKEPPESTAENLLMELIQRNMIQVAKWKLNGKVKTCRMNYHCREKWLTKAEEANFLPCSHSRIANSPNGSGKILRLADRFDEKEHCFSHIHGRDLKKSYFQHYYGDLCSFLSFDSREGPDPGEDIGNFLRRGIARGCFKKLKVIDLEGVFRPNLPESMGQLVELRYLGLRQTYIGKLPSSIGNLINLQTLDLKNADISTLPTSLWKMQQLRHIYLSESDRCRFAPPTSTNSLVDIQTLWGAFVDEETQVNGGLNRLINLRKLGLVCQLTMQQHNALAEWITKLKHLECLRLRSINDTLVEPSYLRLKPLSKLNNLSSIYLFGRLENSIVVHHFPDSLTEITLSFSGLAEDPMPSLEKLPNLRILKLNSGSYTGKIMVCSSGGFPLLRVLNLWMLEELEQWIVEEGALTILREVEIRSCNKLKMIPNGLKHLVHFRELKLTNMPEFNSRDTENQWRNCWKVECVPSIIIKD